MSSNEPGNTSGLSAEHQRQIDVIKKSFGPNPTDAERTWLAEYEPILATIDQLKQRGRLIAFLETHFTETEAPDRESKIALDTLKRKWAVATQDALDAAKALNERTLAPINDEAVADAANRHTPTQPAAPFDEGNHYFYRAGGEPQGHYTSPATGDTYAEHEDEYSHHH